MTNDEKDFVKGCCKFKDYANIEEYVADIQKCLELSSWHYSAEQAKKLIKNDMEYIQKSFEDKDPADDVAADIGFTCG